MGEEIKASSSKQQAALTMDQGQCRMKLERGKHENNNIQKQKT